jgi:hypothetical protein
MSRLKSLFKSYVSQPQYWCQNLSLRWLRTESDLKAVFVVGAPRSGTTLLHTLIAAHSHFYTVPYETALFTWQNLFDRERLGMSIDETIASLKKARDVVDFLDRFVRSLPEFSKDQYFVEKTPQHVNHIKKLMRHFPNAKFVHIHRDVRDCFCSSKSVDTMVSFRDVSFFAKYWNQSVQNGLAFKENPRVYTLSYEDLVTNPDAELPGVMAFLGDSFEQSQTDPAVFGADRRSNLKHFKKLSSPITPISVGRWRSDLTEEQRDVFNSQSGATLKELGYPMS